MKNEEKKDSKALITKKTSITKNELYVILEVIMGLAMPKKIFPLVGPERTEILCPKPAISGQNDRVFGAKIGLDKK